MWRLRLRQNNVKKYSQKVEKLIFSFLLNTQIKFSVFFKKTNASRKDSDINFDYSFFPLIFINFFKKLIHLKIFIVSAKSEVLFDLLKILVFK